MDIFEVIRTADGIVSVAVLLYVYRDLTKRLDASTAYLQEVLRWFLNRTDIPNK